MTEPPFRCSTEQACKTVALKLHLPYESFMQDWPYEVARCEDLIDYIVCYESTTDEDEKFVLMELILQALEIQSDEETRDQYWSRISSWLKSDAHIHAYTVHYWSDPDSNWCIGARLRKGLF